VTESGTGVCGPADTTLEVRPVIFGGVQSLTTVIVADSVAVPQSFEALNQYDDVKEGETWRESESLCGIGLEVSFTMPAYHW
jgi:hypothetical protein